MSLQSEFIWARASGSRLVDKLGLEFFRALPRLPGVYRMIGESGAILYVGKSKNLRARLNSYRLAKADRVSRKILRMLALVEEIRVELCPDEKSALLRENALLREHRPPFNVVNVRTENYYFIGLRTMGGSLEARLTSHEERVQEELERALEEKQHGKEVGAAEYFGAYKGRRSIRDGYSALLRLLWAAHHEIERFHYPAILTRESPQYQYRLAIGEAAVARWMPLLRRFLRGTSRRLLEELTARLLENPRIPPFMYRTIQEDLERVEAFYRVGPWRNKKAKRAVGQAVQTLIEQERLDDMLVEMAFSPKSARGKRARPRLSSKAEDPAP